VFVTCSPFEGNTKTTRRIENRAHESRVFQKNVFYHNEVTICVIEKVTNLDVQIWVFFGEMLLLQQ